MGEIQDEHDHDDGHGTHRCFRPRNGQVDGIRHSPEILHRTNTVSPDRPLLASRKIHLRLSAASPYTSSVDSLPTNNSRILLLGLDFPILKLQSSTTKNTKHVRPNRSWHHSS